MTPRGETMALYRSFLRLRHQFPHKQGRSVLKRWTHMMFSLRQAEYEQVQLREGRQVADQRAREWTEEGQEDLELWKNLAQLDEGFKGRLMDKVILSGNK